MGVDYDRRHLWFSLGYVLGMAVNIVVIIWLSLVILSDPLAHGSPTLSGPL